MNIEICKDVEYIRSVLLEDQEMYERSSDDYTDPVAIQKAFGSVLWLTCIKNDQRIGLAAIKIASSCVLNVHIHIQKQFRGNGTIELGKLILTWIVENAADQYVKINTKIPIIYKDVIQFAHKLGFKDEGIDRLSIMKKGRLIDRLNLGITFEEVML